MDDDMKVLRAARQRHLPSDAAQSAARAALLDRATAAPPTALAPVGRLRLPRMGFRLAAAGGLAVTVAAGVTVAQNMGGTTGGHRPAVPSSSAAPVAYVLNQVADAVQAQPFIAPRNDQWVYLEQRYQSPGKPLSGQVQTARTPLKTRVDRSWTSADGTKGAAVEHGKMVVTATGGAWPRTDYASLKALPLDPAALLVKVRSETVADAPGKLKGSPDIRTFDELNSMLSDGIVPPALEAAIFRVLAKVSGVTVDRKAVDVDGRPALAVSQVAEGWLNREILLDPVTYAYRGQRNVAIKDHADPREGTVTKKGTIDVLISRLAVGVVDRPGQRP